MNKLFVLSLLILTSIQLYSQTPDPMRIEIEANNIEEIFSIALENKSLVLLEHMTGRSSQGAEWKIEVFDSNFKKRSTESIYMPRNFSLIDYKLSSDSILWICFSKKDDNKANILLQRINIVKSTSNSFYIPGTKKAEISSFEVLNNKVFLLGQNIHMIREQIKPDELPFNLKITAPTIPDNTRIIASSINSKTKSISIISNVEKGDHSGIFYSEYDIDGNRTKHDKLNNYKETYIIDGELITDVDNNLYFMGTFNHDMGRQPIQEMIITEGIYIAKIKNGKFDFFKTIEFSDFNNVFSTLGHRSQLKANNRKSKGKKKSINFRMLMHKNTFMLGKLNIFIAETYYPEYHYENNFDSRGYTYQTQVFDGYRTTNCIVAALDSAGNLVWDNHMPISSIRNYTLQQNVLVFPEADSSLVIAYYSNGDISSKIVKGNDVVFRKSQDRIETIFGQSIISETSGNLEKWYDNYFILSGYQELIGSNSRKRKVFFFNKITFD